jgi:hypothetical protein
MQEFHDNVLKVVPPSNENEMTVLLSFEAGLAIYTSLILPPATEGNEMAEVPTVLAYWDVEPILSRDSNSGAKSTISFS